MLCYKCSGRMYTCDVGSCTKCGSFTSSGMFKFCARCAKAQNQCSACLGPLDAVKPEVPADTKLTFLVNVNIEHYRGEWKPTETRKGQARRSRKAFRAWRADVKQLLAERGLAADSLQVTTEMPYIGLLVVQCTKQVAEALRELPGTENVAENDPVY